VNRRKAGASESPLMLKKFSWALTTAKKAASRPTVPPKRRAPRR
jgi:hypothetical protein